MGSLRFDATFIKQSLTFSARSKSLEITLSLALICKQSLPSPFLQLAPNSLKIFQMDLGSSLPSSVFDSYVDCFASWIPLDISFHKILYSSNLHCFLSLSLCFILSKISGYIQSG